MKIFVAGATGVIGRSLVTRLVKAGHDVVGMTNDPGKRAWLRSVAVKPVVVNVFDRAALAAAVHREHPAAVIDELTSLHSGDYSANNHLRDEGTRNLVDAAKASGVERFVAQSYALYAPGEGLATENDRLDLSDTWYTGSITGIVALEKKVNEMPKGVLLRYGTLYGPGTWYGPAGPIAGKLLHGEFLATDDVTSFVHVEDAAQAALLALTWPKGTYNIVDDEPATATSWAPALAALVGGPAPRTITRPQAERQRGVSNAKARRELAWQPIYPSWRDGFKSSFGAATELQRRSA